MHQFTTHVWVCFGAEFPGERGTIIRTDASSKYGVEGVVEEKQSHGSLTP